MASISHPIVPSGLNGMPTTANFQAAKLFKKSVSPPMTCFSSSKSRGSFVRQASVTKPSQSPTSPKPTSPTTLPKMKRSHEDDYPTPPTSVKRIRIRRRAVAKAPNIRKKAPRAITIPPKSRRMDNIKVAHKVTKPPKGSYNEELFDLTSCRLINPLPVKYELLTHSSPCTSTRTESDIEPRFWFPAPIDDDIRKKLFLHPRNRGIVWVGRLAEAKLEAEMKKYHRIKDLWLFEASDAYLPGYDKKAEFIARAFEDEMLSPWVVGWLRELIGAEAVGNILEHIEANLRSSLAGME